MSKDRLKITLSVSQFGSLELKILFSHRHNGPGLLRWIFCEGNWPTSCCGSQPKSQVHFVELSPPSGQTSYSFDSSVHCQEHSHILCLPPGMLSPLFPSVLAQGTGASIHSHLSLVWVLSWYEIMVPTPVLITYLLAQICN